MSAAFSCWCNCKCWGDCYSDEFEGGDDICGECECHGTGLDTTDDIEGLLYMDSQE